jgi:hypothetical protein
LSWLQVSDLKRHYRRGRHVVAAVDPVVALRDE